MHELANEPDPDVLVHYTSDNVCRLILEGQDVLLFDATTSNDRVERLHGIETLWSVLDSAWEFTLAEAESMCSTIDDPTALGLHRIHRVGRLMRRHLLSDAGTLGMVLCTSTAVDDLAMWREYSVDGSGAALLFNRIELSRSVRGRRAGLFRVLYDTSQKETVARFLTVAVVELLGDRGASSWTKYIAEVDRCLSRREVLTAGLLAVDLLSFLFKEPCFRYERETRLIHLAVPDDPLETLTTARGTSRRFRRLSALCQTGRALPIWAVHLGPRMTQSPEQDEIVNICRARGIPVYASELPYRGLDAPVDLVGERLQELRRSFDEETKLIREFQSSDPETARLRYDWIRDHWDRLNDEARARPEEGAE